MSEGGHWSTSCIVKRLAPLICESVLVEYHCKLVTTVTPYDEIYQVGAAIALFCIIFGSSLGVQAQEPSEQGGEGAMRSTHDH